MDELGDQGDVSALIERRSDEELSSLMENLGGNCVNTMAQTFRRINHDRPTCFLAYTVKGWGTPLAGHKDNHGGLMNKTQFASQQKLMGVAEGDEWNPMAGVADKAGLQEFLSQVPFFEAGPRRYQDRKFPVPRDGLGDMSTQSALKILDDLSKGTSALADRIVTASPDVRDHKSWSLGQPAQAFARTVKSDE